MLRILYIRPLALLILISASFLANADDAICGAAPTLPTTAENAESIKGELKGQANVLSKLVGKAELGGQIEAARKNIYQSSDKFFGAQKDAYLAYMFCLVVMGDKTLTTQDKLDAILKYKNSNPTEAVPPTQKPISYDWQVDAERLSYIYSGKAFCDKDPVRSNTCLNTKVGTYSLRNNKESFSNILTVTEKTIGVRTMEFVDDKMASDVRAEADLVDLQAVAGYWTGNYYDGTNANALHLECLAGECVRLNGWTYESISPGKSQRKNYNGSAEISYMVVPLVNNINYQLRIEMQRILARIISKDHNDGGAIACRLLCGGEKCPWITDDCAKHLYR